MGTAPGADFEALVAVHPELESELRLLNSGVAALEAVRGRIEADERVQDPALKRLVEELARRGDFQARYEGRGTIGAGGQGEVREALERTLGRLVAVKSLRPDVVERVGESGGEQLLARFLAEAQITAQLDHPGVVAVHELAVDGDGQPYFTMTRVRGRDLRAVFEQVRTGARDTTAPDTASWSLVRVLSVLQRVCETMSFAHARGVVHRDLKPANVMVGSFGEVYVMDWGLARVSGDDPPETESPPVRAVRTVRGATDAESLLSTLPSENLGTVFYMAPEVAREGAARVGPTIDVYAVGAMLYELLSGRPPYWPRDGEGVTHHQVLEQVVREAPEPLEQRAPLAPSELVSIAGRAMAREPGERYPDMAALEADLRAYLEDRVVKAHATGPIEELKKWIARNRWLAGALGAILIAVLGGLGAVAAVEARGRARLDVQADLYRLPYLEAEAERLWPEEPQMVPAFRAWLATADALVDRLEVHRAELDALRARALTLSEAELATFRASTPLAREISAAELLLAEPATPEPTEVAEREALRASLERMRAELQAQRPFWFARPGDQLRHDTLTQTVEGLESFAAPQGLRAEVRERLEWAERVEALTLVETASAWKRAAAAVARDEGPYADTTVPLEPVLGLVPLGPDAVSGLEEFAFARSGSIPSRGAEGALRLDGSSAMVLVLLPGGAFHRGAQAEDEDAPGYDAGARPEEAPVRELALAPFFVAKHELTQGQWARLGGGRPSSNVDGENGSDTDAHPVEGVSWSKCVSLLGRFGLTLPTEAQWEYAARAGSAGPFLGHGDPRELADSFNLADATVLEAGLGWPQARGMEWLSDGYLRHAPVGSYRPNDFGLHDVLGNVWEWCLDAPGPYSAPVHAGNGLRVAPEPAAGSAASRERVARGGGYVNNPAFARVTIRDMGRSADFDSGYHGLRPALDLAP